MLRRKACIELIAGMPGMGKSSYLSHATGGDKRIIAFDPMRDHEGIEVRSAVSLLTALARYGRGPGCIRYVPYGDIRKAFETFCLGAMAWRNCTVIAEELADVSTIGKASPLWGNVVRESRHFGLNVYATTQRTSECDKTIFGCATRVVIFWLPRQTDRDSIAYDTMVPVERLNVLKDLEFIETDMRGGITPGKIHFS